MNDTKKLRDIADAIEAIEAYSVSSYDEFQERHGTIPWSSMIGTRNIIVHGYDQVKLQIVWKILERDLETLKSEIAKVLA